MNFQHIYYLIEVAKLKSIGKASQSLYVSQSSISNAIKNIESEYGVIIFKRTSKGVSLTREGEELLVDLERIMYQIQYAKIKYSNKRSKSKFFCVSSQHHLGSLKAFQKLHKSVEKHSYRLGFLECRTIEVLETVESGIADIGVIFYTESSRSAMNQELKNKNLAFHHIVSQKPHAYVRKGHALSNKISVVCDDLHEYPAITYDQTVNSTGLFTELSSRSLDFNETKVIYTNDRAAATEIINGSDAYLIGSGLKESNEFAILPIVDTSDIEIGWVVRNDYKLSEISKLYLEYLLE